METSKCVSCCLTAGLIQTRGRGRYVGGLPATGLTRSHPPTSQARETPMHYAAHADEPEILYMLAWFGGNPDLSNKVGLPDVYACGPPTLTFPHACSSSKFRCTTAPLVKQPKRCYCLHNAQARSTGCVYEICAQSSSTRS